MNFTEFVQSQPKLESGVIKDVHILGLKSKNGREYSKDAVMNATKLYENKPVYIDHEAGKERKAEDKFGQLSNVVCKEDGLWGDLTYLTTHPMASRIQEDINKNLNFFGLSHDAAGKARRDKSGKVIVESINAVNTVDIVSNPATVTGLLESVQQDIADVDDSVEQVKEETKESPAESIKLSEVTSLKEQISKMDLQITSLLEEVKVLRNRKWLVEPTSSASPKNDEADAMLKDPKKLSAWLKS